jgi:hypothetical protein
MSPLRQQGGAQALAPPPTDVGGSFSRLGMSETADAPFVPPTHIERHKTRDTSDFYK